MRAGDGGDAAAPAGGRRRRADESSVHHAAARSGGVRQGVRAENRDPVSLHGSESRRVRGGAEGAANRSPYPQMVSMKVAAAVLGMGSGNSREHRAPRIAV